MPSMPCGPRCSHLPRRARVLLAAAAALGVAMPLMAQDEPERDPRIDDQGRDVGVFPPDPRFDYRHFKLDMEIPDMSQPKFTATATMQIRPIATAQAGISLRAGPGLTINTVGLNGARCEFTRSDDRLEIKFPTSVAAGQTATLEIQYDADKPGGGGAGLTWSKDDPKTPEVDFMFHSQGQPESNNQWFPCHDFPNVRLTSEIIVTVPAEYDALSNGKLIEVKRYTDGSKRTTFHWLQEQPHSFYLISLIVSKFDVVNVGGKKSARPGLWMPVYGPLGSGDNIRQSFSSTAEMVALYEKMFDEPYPYDKYAQSIARDFSAGAMENTSASTFAPFAATARGNFLEGIIAHELVHQWMGDLVGYKSWEHLWLGEGWATYGEAMWAEHKNGNDGYQRAILSNMRRERGSGRGYYPRSPGMATNRYSEPDQRFMSADNVYSKGGFVIHMLRQRIGDDAFWKGVANYIDRFKYSLAESDDFRRCLEEVSGQSLERFFDQWVRRPGNPSLEVDYTWDEESKSLKVVMEQMQRVDADNPVYAITVPLAIEKTAGGEWKTVYVNMDSRRAEQTITLDAKPASIEVDPNMTVLMRPRVRQPLAVWMNQAENGSTYFARAQAIDALAEFDGPEVAALLAKLEQQGVAADDEYLRTLAAASLKTVTTRYAAAPDAR